MDYRSFGAAAYGRAAGNKDKKDDDKKAKKQTGEVIRGGNSQNVKTASFQPVDFGAFSKSEKSSFNETKSFQGAFSKSEKTTSSDIAGKKVTAPNWAKISKADSNPINKTSNSGVESKKQSFGNQLNKEKKDENIDFTSGIKASPSQRLENATDYLKSGGLLKVPIKEADGGKESNYRKVAKFLVLIGEDEAAKVLPLLSEKQIERIIPEIASIRTVSKEEAAVIFEEFNGIVKQVKQQGGVETAREMLTKAYGAKRADEMLKKAMPMGGKTPFAYLNDLDKERVYLLLKDENIGVQALALSYIEPKLSAGVINLMKPEAKKEIVMRLAKMEPVSPEVLRRIDQGMHEKSLNQTVEESENIDGRNALAQILKKMDVSAENDILTTLADEDPDLGQDLRSRLFTLDDVINADDRFIQEKLREMTEVDIAYLIAGKTDEFKEKILSNISANRRYEVRQQDEIYITKRRSDVDKITGEFLTKLRLAFEEGELRIKDRNDEEYV